MVPGWAPSFWASCVVTPCSFARCKRRRQSGFLASNGSVCSVSASWVQAQTRMDHSAVSGLAAIRESALESANCFLLDDQRLRVGTRLWIQRENLSASSPDLVKASSTRENTWGNRLAASAAICCSGVFPSIACSIHRSACPASESTGTKSAARLRNEDGEKFAP